MIGRLGTLLGEAPLVGLSREIGSDQTPEDLLLLLRDEPGLVALIGDWATGAVLASRPVCVVPEAHDPFSTLGSLPWVDAGDTKIGGGWIGYLGYRLGATLEPLRGREPPRPRPLPRHTLAFYDNVLRYDAETKTWWFEALISPHRRAALERRCYELGRLLERPAPSPRSYSIGGFWVTPRRDGHIAAVERCLEYIGAGDIFQANITMRLEAPFSGDPLDVFAAGVAHLRPAYAAYLTGNWGAVASFSPELFLRRKGNIVRTEPIKGTAPRGTTVVQDELVCRSLSASTKDAAENVMIVDLMRNDFGRVCSPGTVTVPALMQVEPHAGVWHLVSTVVGALPDGVGDGQLLRATFPPGSVTGAPKVRSMEIIRELEATEREVYTGSIICTSPVSGLTASVVIRTFEFSENRMWLGLGGGIVADSIPAREYEECGTKARPLLAAVGGAATDDASDHRDAPRLQPRRV